MMDELKECPFCGSSNATLDYYEISCPQELGTIVVCNDCGASAKSIVDWNTRPIEDELQARIAELEEAQRWIPVSERLPEFNKVVAVIDMSDKDSHLCNVYETAILVEVRGDTRFGFIGHSGWDSSDVTHWMPLPKLPEVQE